MNNSTILFFVEKTNFRIKNKIAVKSWLFDAIIQENKTLGYINIILCTDDYLHNLNQKYLSHDTLTDIITFDFNEKELLVGEIFISIDRVKENAGIYGIKVVDELHRVIIHGVLHLCGYKDKSRKDKKLMTDKENYYLLKRPEKLIVTT
jgi:rRNA maturation RNase YbeY